MESMGSVLAISPHAMSFVIHWYRISLKLTSPLNLEMIQIDLQNDYDFPNVPDDNAFLEWVEAALQSSMDQLEQSIRLVDDAESQQLNAQYRGKDKPTNVLSFPAEPSEYLGYQNLGDLVICVPVVEREAIEQNKPLLSHWAHMVIHGMLHLQGYDHLNDDQAHEMEQLEIEILAGLGHTNPYLDSGI
jgi:probable rRNA maturation factor